MSFTETTSRSWFSRIGGGVKAIFIGILLVIGMVVLLFWNEGRAVKTAKALAEGAAAVISVDAGTADPANDGKLVHIAGNVAPQGEPRDPAFGISAAGAVGLERVVEMYQWNEVRRSETRKKLGGGEETVTTYNYEQVWSPREISSSNFKVQDGHQNPPFPVQGESFTVPTATIGKYSFDGSRIASLGSATPIALDAQLAASVARAAPASAGRYGRNVNGTVVFGSPQAPRVGDYKISYKAVSVSQASLVGKQQGNTLTAYETSNGRSLFLAQSGIKEAKAMFDDAIAANTATTWGLRVLGLVLMYVGFRLTFSIVGIIGDVIPFVGSILRMGTGLVAFVLTAILGPVVIALGWITYRPLLAGAIILVGLVLAFGGIKLGRKKAAENPEPAESAEAATPQFGRDGAG